MLRDYKNVRLDDSTDLVGEEPDGKERFLHQTETGFAMDRKKCPLCGYPLQLRYKAAYGLRLYLCTNDAEICGFMTNDLRGGRMSILKCDRCADGYLIVRTKTSRGMAKAAAALWDGRNISKRCGMSRDIGMCEDCQGRLSRGCQGGCQKNRPLDTPLDNFYFFFCAFCADRRWSR